MPLPFYTNMDIIDYTPKYRSNILINYFCAKLEYLTLEDGQQRWQMIRDLKEYTKNDDKIEIDLEIYYQIFGSKGEQIKKGELIEEHVPLCIIKHDKCCEILFLDFDNNRTLAKIINMSDYHLYMYMREKKYEELKDVPF